NGGGRAHPKKPLSTTTTLAEPFAPLLKMCFQHVTGFNPRRREWKTTAFTKAIASAQERFLECLQTSVSLNKRTPSSSKGSWTCSSEIPMGWLAAGVGVLSIS